ncbi:MAG: DUF1223 domain-containing protein [Ferruginibacter sp.]|nr:DUF1223 domain-containing protein [Cytophagales bacterium]
MFNPIRRWYTGVIVAFFLTHGAFVPEAAVRPASEAGFSLVELFTSEGCSSCPPADRLVSQLNGEVKGRPVYVLTYHVDYWNHLGWKDAYSDAAFSKRQRQYAGWLRLPGVYTPQAVVNGRVEFVGSNAKALRSAVESHLAQPVAAQLTVSGNLAEKNQVKLFFRASAAGTPVDLLIAFVQKRAESTVARGENEGKKLSHVQVVRKLEKIRVDDANRHVATLPLPPGFHPAQWEVVTFLQNPGDGHVLAASRVAFESAMGTRKPSPVSSKSLF